MVGIRWYSQYIHLMAALLLHVVRFSLPIRGPLWMPLESVWSLMRVVTKKCVHVGVYVYA